MKQFIVDAFSDRIFHGNPAAVCILEQPLSDELMQNIAIENNLSETAFAVRNGSCYDLRWFTPGGEVPLCGHATLATSFVLFRFYEPGAEGLVFRTLSGELRVCREGEFLVMDFPAFHGRKIPVTELMTKVMGTAPREALLDEDLLLVYENEEIIRKMTPDFVLMKQLDGLGVAVSAPGREFDCVSRYFAPKLKVNEDPVTGAAHCLLVPYWAERFGKNRLQAWQASARGGELRCDLCGNRVILAGKAALYSTSELNIENF